LTKKHNAPGPRRSAAAQTAPSTQSKDLIQRTPRLIDHGNSPRATQEDFLGPAYSSESLLLSGGTLGADWDPRLQRAILNRRAGVYSSLPIASTAGDEVAVVARVRDESTWRNMADVHPGTTLGKARDGSILVTGRIPVDRIESIHVESNILSIQASQPVYPALDATTRTMNVGILLPPEVQPAGGKGVVVGIVDTGADFAHLNFRHKDGKTRLLGIWDQNGVSQAGAPVKYGRFYSTSEIDDALNRADPYVALGYGPLPDSITEWGTHGTHVMDIAAGNGFGSSVPGVAPEADLLFVELSSRALPWKDQELTKYSFGDSVEMLEAVEFIFSTAKDRPCVVNVSLGMHGGPHDGTSLVEQGLDALVRDYPNRAVVIAAGNYQGINIHTSGTVPAQGSFDLLLNIAHGGGELEVWSPSGAKIEASLVGPANSALLAAAPGTMEVLTDAAGVPKVVINNSLKQPNNGCAMIGVWLASDVPAGIWNLRLRSANGKQADFHAWIERDPSSRSTFVNPVHTHTLGSLSTGYESIAVGNFDGHKAPAFPIASSSSAGPTRDGREKPELSAPGSHVVAARSRTKSGVVRKSGTSMAAPAVTGLVALMLAEARRHGKSITIDQIRSKLRAGAQGAGGWHPQFGNGRAHANAI
jgi:subtilisin family serine protease